MLRVQPYNTALAIGNPEALHFLSLFRERIHAGGQIPPDLSAISLFCWQPRYPSSLLPEILAGNWRERGIRIVEQSLEAEDRMAGLPEWVTAESVITFHLQPGEFPTLQFFEPLLKEKPDVAIFVIKNLAVSGMVMTLGGMITFVEKEAAPASVFINSILQEMAPKAATSPASTFEEAFGSEDPSAAPREEMRGVEKGEFDAVASDDKRENPQLVIEVKETNEGKVRVDDITQPLEPIRLAFGDTSPLGLASIEPAVTAVGEVERAHFPGEPSQTAIIAHQPQEVMRARRLDAFRFLWAEVRLALLRRKMKRLAARKQEEPPELLEKGRALTKRMEELGKRLGIGERMQREMQDGRFSFFISLIRRIRNW